MARLYRGKRNRGAEETVPIAMMTRSCGPPGKLDDDDVQTAAEAAHAGQNGAHSQFFSTRQLSPAALSELHTLAAAFIDTKGPIEAR